MTKSDTVEASAPGKVILFGEHAINRGQPAVAAAFGLYARCRVGRSESYRFRAGERQEECGRDEIERLSKEIQRHRYEENFEAIRRIAREDYFGPQKYLLWEGFRERLPEGLEIEWQSEIPSSSGLGSGGAAFTAMVGAVCELLAPEAGVEERARWAQLGDVVAHGGVASGLDTQTSLLGGVIRFTGKGLAERVEMGAGMELVVAHAGVSAATSEVNSRVRKWLAAEPVGRLRYFETIGALTRAAVPAIERGDWDEVGRLLTLNQLVLEKIGVSTPELDRLIQAALGAEAYGAKISGSGGGGIMVALASVEKVGLVRKALSRAGGKVFDGELGVPGVRIERAAEAVATERI